MDMPLRRKGSHLAHCEGKGREAMSSPFTKRGKARGKARPRPLRRKGKARGRQGLALLRREEEASLAPYEGRGRQGHDFDEGR